MHIFRIRFQDDRITLIAKCQCDSTVFSTNSFIVCCPKCSIIDKIAQMKFNDIPIFMLINAYTKEMGRK